MNTEGELLVQRILNSEEWSIAQNWGQARPGHPEGTIRKHVLEQVLPFIDLHYGNLPDYWDLITLAYLHDIGKPLARYEGGRLVGENHSVISAQIASKLGASSRLLQVIISNDRPYSYWQQLTKADGYQPERWTEARRQRFLAEFRRTDLDVVLLILFHRADNAYRRAAILSPATDTVCWFENTLVTEAILGFGNLPTEGQDERRKWLPSEQITKPDDIEFIPPWVFCGPGFEGELKRESRFGHVLHRVSAQSVARRLDCDDVLFSLQNHKEPLAVVHLTWAKFEATPQGYVYCWRPRWLPACCYFPTTRLHNDRLHLY